MFFVADKIVFAMAMLRCLSASIEMTAAMLMLKYGRVETALKINAVLALVGPSVMIIVTTLGLAGLAGKISLSKLGIIFSGVALIFYGISRP
ncbi:YqhV family protein [Desulfotomaculum sp. 1211_IL3151]|uniref:YqhV family protein n=1 Tax=Desulfotomaculum sp. 1211_IL3151 TaxID=3084055 RepID=UPI002FDA5B63